MDTNTARDMEIIAGRLQEEFLSSPPAMGAVREQLSRLTPDGCWPDMDYEDRARTHWSPSGHVRRLGDLSRAFRRPGHDLSGDEGLRKALLSALHFWVSRDPQSDNWWFNCIDTPKHLGAVLLLLGDAIPREDFEGAVRIVRRSGFERTGANLTWEAGNLMVLACATRDPDLLQASIERITAEIRVSTSEGVQPDFSFHQHGPQLYMSNYGEVFSADNSRYAALFTGTGFALGPDKIAALSGLIREGQQWFVWGRQLDYHALGRQIDNPGATYRGRGFEEICGRMASVDPDHAAEYGDFARRVSGKLPASGTGPKGNRYFYRSDTMVHRPGNFSVCLRMHSSRTYAVEVRVNRENLKGYYLSDGVYFLLQRGDEYHEIQPVWDWRKLPGATCRDTDEPFPYGREVPPAGNTRFVGGVSDGRSGAAVMDYAKDGVTARKAWFFLDHGFVCLGAGIASETGHRVTTAVNQCLHTSPVSVLRDGQVRLFPQPGVAAGPIQGVHHDAVGYFSLEPQEVSVSVRPRTGTWTEIEERSPHLEPVTQDVFTLWTDHGPAPRDGRYAWEVLPGLSQEAFAGAAGRTPVEILANRPDLQAVSCPAQRIVQAVFYEPCRLEMPGKRAIQPDAPCLLILRLTGGSLLLSIADPTQELDRLGLVLTGRFSGEGCVFRPQENLTAVAVDLPRDGAAGRSVQLSLRA